MASEKQFENKIKRYLKDHGCWYVKYFANSFTKSGIPDILACVNGQFIAIEVKAENGTPSKLQLWNRDEIRKAGGISIILYPSQWDEFTKLMNDFLSDIYPYESSQYNFDKRR